MSRRRFLEDMRLDTGAGRRESLIASPIKVEDPESSVHELPSEQPLFASSAGPSTGEDAVATSQDGAPRENDIDPLLIARARSNTVPFNYLAGRQADSPLASTSGNAPASSPLGATDASPDTSPRTARPGGSRVPVGPVVIPHLSDRDTSGEASPDDHHALPGVQSGKDTPRPGGEEGAYAQYMQRRTSVDRGGAGASAARQISPSATATTAHEPSSSSAPSPNREASRSTSTHDTDMSDVRTRSGSITRVENTLVAVQIELAREKKNNIDAEQRLHALAREVETLRAENTRLSAAIGVAARRGSDNANWLESGTATASSAPTSQYVEELEQTVRQLSKNLASKEEALAAREERIRLLEHRLVDQMLGGETGAMTPGTDRSREPLAASRSFARSSSPSTSLTHIHEVKAAELKPYDSRIDAPTPSHTTATPTHTTTSSATPGVFVVNSRKLDVGSPEREVGATSALRRRATDADMASGPVPAQPHESPAPRNISPRRRANSAVVAKHESGVAAGHDGVPRRRASVVRRKTSTASTLDQSGPSHTAKTSSTPSSGPRAPPGLAASARPRRKGSMMSSTDTSVNTTTNTSTPLRRRSSVAGGPRPSPLRRQSQNASLGVAAGAASSSATAGDGTRTGSARRRSSVTGSVNSSAPRRASAAAHPVQLQRAPNVASQGPGSAHRASMLASYATPYRTSVSPTRSIAPSMRSATSTKSRPQITFSAKDDVTTMKGTTTTVVFRSRSPATTDFSPSRSPYTSALTPERGNQPFVSEQFSETTYHPNRLVRTPQEAPMEST